ncbi:hypothetical protein [Aeromonas sobria]|uniref:hypothetical protein n=1 Tax=Aeromonas sobria TaxID=646 RepID=UPI001117A223|nr:hypothetical protein [Aeromonas sobria]TNH85981.1 hypothetical protein CF140_04680 [Aeromonas sobria]
MEENSGNILNQEIVDILGTLTESEAESFEDAEKGKMVPYVMGCFFLTPFLAFPASMLFGIDDDYIGGILICTFVILVFVTHRLILRSARRNIKLLNTGLSHYMRETIGSLKKVDYFCRSPYSGLAVDVEDKKIALIEGDLWQPTDTKVMLYPLNKIKNVRFFQPDVNVALQSTNINNGGAVGLAQNTIASISDKAFNNIAVSDVNIEAAKNTGLYFDFDDIHNQQAFLMMSAEQAERWILIFEKLFDGSLEPQPRPLEFPQDVCIFHKRRVCK